MKNKIESLDLSRRHLLSAIIPVCSVSCLSLGGVLNRELPMIEKIQDQEEKHKFLKEFGTLSIRDRDRLRFREYLALVDILSKEFGMDRIIELIKNHTAERMLQRGKDQGKEIQKDHFKSYINMFRSPGFQDTLTFEIVEDTDTVFVIKVTECIAADTFLHYNAGDIGFARVCWGDYAWAKGYHPNIVLTRDKTLMEGHAYCNHRYAWVG